MTINIPSVQSIIHRFGLMPKKSLGQNFLIDLSIADQIVEFADIKNTDNVIEIGPGAGSLSRIIMQANPNKLYAIEIDQRAIEALKYVLGFFHQDHYEIIKKDALKLELKEIAPSPVKVIANLPYNIGTELLYNWFRYVKHFDSLTLMFQKEVAERITAKPHTGQYGKLSVLAQFLCNVKFCLTVPAEAFYPAPKVLSGVIKLVPKQDADFSLIEPLTKTLNIIFSQRRKMLRAVLKSHMEQISHLQGEIDFTMRAENLDIIDIIKLTKALWL